MPMAKDLFEKFEKGKTNAATSPSTPGQPPAVAISSTSENKKNVNSWHWEEQGYEEWAKKRLAELISSAEIPVQGTGSIKISSVSEVKGEAYINVRKNKLIHGFMLSVDKIEWQGEIKDADGNNAVECKGTCLLEEIDGTMDSDEFEVAEINLESASKKIKGSHVLLTVMKKVGKEAILEKVREFVKEFKSMKPAGK